MLIDELREQLKAAEPDVATVKVFWQNTQRSTKLQELSALINTEDFWKHPQRDLISSEHHGIKEQAETYNNLVQAYQDFNELIEMFKDNEQELLQVKLEIGKLCRTIRKFKIELLLHEPGDASNCFLSINAGAGGTESQDWANILLRMYIRFCERENFVVEVLDLQSGEEAGIKSAILYIKKKNAAGLLKSESGIHRLVRISPYDANKRRHTSFAAVTITAEVEDAAIEINESDLRIDTYRAGGAGGQHVNKTDSAVRITHLPSGIVVQCQAERSQLQNKVRCMKMLKAKLIEKRDEEKRTKEGLVEKKKIEWGSQIRSYVLHPYKMVKDHRTEIESHQPDEVLDGDLMPFIEGYLVTLTADGDRK